MNVEEKIEKCVNFYKELATKLKDKYEIVGSCNNDISSYLVPNGTSEDISYTGKPPFSFRVSDHWNWYSNLKKCPDEHYVQCYSVDCPWPKKRLKVGKASKPIWCAQVAFYGEDNKYHVIFGEKFDRKSKEWSWIEPTVDDAILALGL